MSYTARLLNFVEPYYIDGTAKTAFWTGLNTDLKTNDKVFIINGYYDSEVFIKKGKWTKNADGYRVLFVDRCKVVLDIDYESGIFAGLTQTYKEDSWDNYIKVYNIRSQREFDYINKIYVDSYTASRVPKFELNLTNNIIYSDIGWTGATGIGANSGIATTKSFWARRSYNWINITSQFVNNSFTFSPDYIAKGMTNNSRILVIGEDLKYGNSLLKERNIYKWTGSASWAIDIEYKQPILSKLYFKSGVFKGIHNDGVFGNYTKSENWSGTPSVWNSGFFVNSVWRQGQMKSKSTSSQPSYYSSLVNGQPVQTTDFSNNRGYGYNFIIDSDILAGSIDNGNFINSNIGFYNTGLTAVDEYFGFTNSYGIELKGGFYNYCDINNTKISKSTTLDSIIKNSFLNDSRTFNSQIQESYLNTGEFSVTEASIKIITADLSSYIPSGISATSSSIRSILKLYIEDKDINRLDNFDSFYITKINKEYLLSNLDSDLRIWLPLESKYILDTFYDFPINSVSQECFASIKTKFDNKYITLVDFNGTTYSNTSSINDNYYASIDIDLSKYLAFYRYLTNYYFLNQSYLDKSNVSTAFKNTSLSNSDFRDGVVKNIIWESGSHLNYRSNIIKWENNNLKITKLSSQEIKVYLTQTQSSIKDNTLRKGSYVWLDSIEWTGNSNNKVNLTGAYKVATYSLDELILASSTLAGLSSSGTYSVMGIHKPTYLSVHNLLIEDSTIKNGLFIRSLFWNSNFENSLINSNDRNLNNQNVQKLRVINNYFIFSTASSVNTIRSGVFHNSHFLNINWLSGIADNSIWSGPEFKGGVFNYGIWTDGTFSGGVFQNSRGVSYSVEDYDFQTTFYRNWSKGNFNDGEFYNSVWLDGTFNLGKLYASDWYGGVWNNGILGDKNVPISNTTMAKYLNIGTGATMTIWNNGMVENAEVGGLGYIDWFDGKFNGGIFSASASTSTNRSIWYNGQFNGGNFSGMAKWKNGIFNSGKFNSYYGFTLSNSTYSIDYSWETGEFKGGQFGEESYSSNSTWYDGQFYDGIFKGKVWNKGIFLGGSFEGSYTQSVTFNPASFSESFTQSFWGLWRGGFVTDLKHKADPSFVVPINNNMITQLTTQKSATLKNSLWLSGTFDHPSGEIINSAWLNGKFKAGKFTNGVFNPYVRRDWWNDSYGTYSSFNFDFANCQWENGDFKGDFYISDWLNGNFISGTMSGARWFDGIWRYGNAKNIYWENGTWKNGNWDGSPFDLNSLTFTQSEHRMVAGPEKDILMRIANIHQIGKIHVINAFTGSYSDDIFDSWTFSNTSNVLTDWNPALSYWYLPYGSPSNPIINVTDNQANTPNGYNTTTITLSGSITENDEYSVYIYDGYISVTASSTDTLTSLADRLVNEITSGLFQAIVKYNQWTTNGYLTRYFTWNQINPQLDIVPIAISLGSGVFTIQTPLDVYPTVRAQSGFNGSSIYKQSEKLYAVVDDGLGLTTSIFTQSGDIFNISLNVYNYFGRTDFLINLGTQQFRETMLTTGPKTFNYSIITEAPGTNSSTSSLFYVERLGYDNPDNSSFQVEELKINRLESFYDNIINNKLYTFGTYSSPFTYGPTGTTMSLPGRLLTGLVVDRDAVSIKFGNGVFKYGLWENGYWNNGWHASWDNQREYVLFSDVVIGGFIELVRNLWIVKITALTNTDGLEIGDRVSIGNLVFIDVNEKRRLVRTWYRIVNKTNDTITVEINVNFSVRRIEKDSKLHLIYVSKTIWQSGIFHNGYFRGIWNYGLFRGYPYITQMENTQWVDGIFDGGAFKSNKSYYLSQGVSQSYNNGLIQNFIFRDNNTAKVAEFKYNSWVDTNYFTFSMTNLFRDNLRYDSNWGVVMSSGNLKGYPSEDVLSSNSIFRNSFNSEIKWYNLGLKYTIYNDFLKRSAYFSYPFNISGAPGPSNFLSNGWTYTANFIQLHGNSRGTDDNVLQVDYQQESYSNIGVKFVQTSKLSYFNTNSQVTTRTGSPDSTYGWISGDFSSPSRYSVYINDVVQPVGTKFSNRSYAYNNWPLRTPRSGQSKLNNDIDNNETLTVYTNVTTGQNAPAQFTLIGDTEKTWRRVYMLDLFNPTQSDASFGGYNRSGQTPNEFQVIPRQGADGSNVGGTDWNHITYKVLNNTRLKINAFIPFQFSAIEKSTGNGLDRRNGWSTFKLVGIVERIKAENLILGNAEDKWEYVTSTEFNFYPDSYFGSLQGSRPDLYGFMVNKSSSTITFDSTSNTDILKGYLKIDGYEADFKKNDLLRFRLYWIDVRKMFASSNQTGDGAPGDMTLIIGKFPGISYTENNHGYWEIIDTSTYVNQNTNLLDNTKANNIERFRYSVVDFDLDTIPNSKYQGTSSVGDDTLPSIFLLNSDYPQNLPGNFSDVINHGLVPGNKKEYFYNRKSLNMFFKSTESFTAKFSKIQFYETDMIPFFRYTDEAAVNQEAQSPYYGVAPLEAIADGSLSLDTISYTSPFQGNVPIRGVASVPGSGSPGSGGGGGGSNPPIAVYYTVNYIFRNESQSGVNEFTSYYSILEYDSSNTLIRTVDESHLAIASVTTGFINIPQSNYIDILVRGTYSVVPANNISKITITTPSTTAYYNESSPATNTILTTVYTPQTDITVVLEVEAEIVAYYYDASPYDCDTFSPTGPQVVLLSYSSISLGYFVCAGGQVYILDAISGSTSFVYTITESNSSCTSLSCYIP